MARSNIFAADNDNEQFLLLPQCFQLFSIIILEIVEISRSFALMSSKLSAVKDKGLINSSQKRVTEKWHTKKELIK